MNLKLSIIAFMVQFLKLNRSLYFWAFFGLIAFNSQLYTYIAHISVMFRLSATPFMVGNQAWYTEE